MKALVTGVAGFLGSHLADALLADGHTVIGVDNMIGGYEDNVPAGVDFRASDCNDLDAMTAAMVGVELVYHLAAVPHEGLSVFSPKIVAEHTFMSTISTFVAAARAGTKRFVFTSSSARYGNLVPPAVQFTEAMPACPRDVYGVTKVAAEEALRCLAGVHGMELVIAVPHNIIGTRQKYDDPFRNVASIMINRMLQHKQPIIFGDGEQTRPFSAVSDCVESLARMAYYIGLDGELINIGPDGVSTTVNELARVIADILHFPLAPIYVPERPVEVKHVSVSADKARRLLGYETRVTLEATLEEMVAWVLARGAKPFLYHLPIEINTAVVPAVWRDRLL